MHGQLTFQKQPDSHCTGNGASQTTLSLITYPPRTIIQALTAQALQAAEETNSESLTSALVKAFQLVGALNLEASITEHAVRHSFEKSIALAAERCLARTRLSGSQLD